MADRGTTVDRITQSWVKATGRPIDFAGTAWLDEIRLHYRLERRS
jgi:hypothetical protein